MLKRISVLALAGVLTLPGAALAGGDGSLEAKIEALSRQLAELKAQVETNKQSQEQKNATIDQGAARWDHASRFNWSGDFRSRYDYYSRERKTGSGTVTDKNNSMMTNRLRLNMYTQVQDNVEFIGRLAMYKAWGMQGTPGTPGDHFGAFPPFDGNSTRQPSDSALRVDRAFVNWNNINDTSFWFSIGRRPTTDGPPSNIKQGIESRMATPAAYMDWPFDGLTIGYAYDNLFNIPEMPGRIRFCYGRGFEAGLGDTSGSTLNDTDFAGISWDIYKKDNRFVYLQSYVAMDVFNYPDWANADEYTVTSDGTMYTAAGRKNIGNIFHTVGTFMDKLQNLNYFVSGAWSRSDPNELGMLNDYTGPGAYTSNNSKENGYSIYLGARYDLPQSPFKLGLEYNHGSEYWIGMSPGHDDLYASKLATRGNVYEIYGIYDIPGRPASWLGNAFIRVGYQHYDYNYTGSMDWNVKPYKVDDAASVAKAGFAGQKVIESAEQIYVTFETTF